MEHGIVELQWWRHGARGFRECGGRPVEEGGAIVGRLRAALSRRDPLLSAQGKTNGMRLLNGESDGFPGLVKEEHGLVPVAVQEKGGPPHGLNVGLTGRDMFLWPCASNRSHRYWT